MSIVTISRGTFSGAKAIAECVSGRLGYDCVSREVLLHAAREYGVSIDALVAARAEPLRFVERLGRQRDVYVAVIRASLAERALRGKLIYHGNAGHFLLGEVGHVLRVRVIAPLEFRIDAAMKALRVPRDRAFAHIERVDRQRSRWTQFLYGASWDDPRHYDLLLNLEKMGIEGACEVVAQATSLPVFEPNEESFRTLRAIALRSRVEAALAADLRTRDASVQVQIVGSNCRLRGWVRLQSTLDAIPAVVRSVPGVGELEFQVVVRSGIVI
jgi:cytidylate kinase